MSSFNFEKTRRKNFKCEGECPLPPLIKASINCCSTKLVEKLDLQVIPHPKPFKLQWLNEDGDLTIDKRVKVSLTVGSYKDEILCDVVPIEACHILLGRPWQFDKKNTHDGLTNEITLTNREMKFVLHPLTPSQVVKDQIQIKQKTENEKKIIRKSRESP